jgi:hypothetical protein
LWKSKEIGRCFRDTPFPLSLESLGVVTHVERHGRVPHTSPTHAATMFGMGNGYEDISETPNVRFGLLVFVAFRVLPKQQFGQSAACEWWMAFTPPPIHRRSTRKQPRYSLACMQGNPPSNVGSLRLACSPSLLPQSLFCTRLPTHLFFLPLALTPSNEYARDNKQNRRTRARAPRAATRWT